MNAVRWWCHALLGLSIFLFAGCADPTDTFSWGQSGSTPQPAHYSSSNGASDFSVDPVRPNLSMYPEFAPNTPAHSSGSHTSGTRTVAVSGPASGPRLIPLPLLKPGAHMPGVTAMSAAGNANPSPGIMPGLMPQGMEPVQQLIYGGDNQTHDAPEKAALSARDRLKVDVRFHPEFSGMVEIQDDGSLQIPNTSDFVQAEGRTVEELRQLISERISPYIREKPEVIVTVEFAMGGFYFVFGEVANQGRFPMGLKPIRLSEAIFRANSARFATNYESEDRQAALREETEISARENFELSKYAKLTDVYVISPHRSRPSRASYDVKAALFQGVQGQDPVLRPGQIVFVPSTVDKRFIEFVNRFIAPLRAARTLEDESEYWYHRTTGNRVTP